MSADRPPDVALARFPLATLRALESGSFDRPADWHPQYAAESLRAVGTMLLTAYDVLERPVDDHAPWWVFAVVVDGRVVGDAGFHGPPASDPPYEVEIGYQVVPALRGRGVATRACALLLAHAWEHGADRVRADTDPANAASRAVLRANGFRATGPDDFCVEAPDRTPA